MSNGFDMREFEQYEKDLIALATEKLPKQSKKFLKKEANKLSKKQKEEIKSFGIGDTGEMKKEIISRSKSGKVYKYSGDLSCRAFNSHPLAHLLDQGFIHKGGKNHDGEETFVAGYNFIKKAEDKFKSDYYQDVEDFIDNMIDEGL